MRTCLNQQAGVKAGQVKFWSLVGAINKEVAKIAGLQDRYYLEKPQLRKHNFENCFIKLSKGQAYRTEDGVKVKKFSCGSKYCFFCRDKERGRVVSGRMDIVKQAYEYGMERIPRLVFTMPKELALKLLDKEVQKKVRQKLKPYLRQLVGANDRDNVGIDWIIHPVGDSDITGDHVHLHVNIYPLAIRKDEKTGDYNVVTFNKKWLNKDFLRDAWNLVLGEIFGEDAPCATYPNIRYIDLKEMPIIKNNRVSRYETSDERWGRVRQRLNYDLRSFARDFQDKAVGTFLHDNEQHVVVKGAEYKDGVKYPKWTLLSVEEYAMQWMWVVDNNKIETGGFIKGLNKYIEAGIFSREESEEDDITDIEPEDCTIYLKRGKTWSQEKKRLVMIREDWVYLQDGTWLQIGIDASWLNARLDNGGVNVCEAAPPPPE